MLFLIYFKTKSNVFFVGDGKLNLDKVSDTFGIEFHFNTTFQTVFFVAYLLSTLGHLNITYISLRNNTIQRHQFSRCLANFFPKLTVVNIVGHQLEGNEIAELQKFRGKIQFILNEGESPEIEEAHVVPASVQIVPQPTISKNQIEPVVEIDTDDFPTNLFVSSFLSQSSHQLDMISGFYSDDAVFTITSDSPEFGPYSRNLLYQDTNVVIGGQKIVNALKVILVSR